MPQYDLAEQATIDNIVVKRWTTPQLIELFRDRNLIASHVWLDTAEDTTAKMATKFAQIVERLTNPPTPMVLAAPSVVAVGYAEDRKYRLMDNGSIDVFNEDDHLIGTIEYRGDDTESAMDRAKERFVRITGRPLPRKLVREEILASIEALGTSEPIFESKGNAPEGGSFEDDQRLKNSRRRRTSSKTLTANLNLTASRA